MTKEITKTIILQQLQDRFKLREFEPANFLFDETVMPVYDISREVDIPKAEFKAVSITSATSFHFFTVPENEKWKLNTYNIIFMATGAYKVTGLFIERKNYPASLVYLDMIKGQTISYAVHLPAPVSLFSGDQIHVLIDDYTSTADLRVYIDYIVEEIR